MANPYEMTRGKGHRGPPGPKYPQGYPVQGSNHPTVYQSGDTWGHRALPSNVGYFPFTHNGSGSSTSPVPSISSAETVVSHARHGLQGLNPAAPPYYGYYQAIPYSLQETGYPTPRGGQQAVPYSLPGTVCIMPRGGQQTLPYSLQGTVGNTPRGGQQAITYSLPENTCTTPRGGQNSTAYSFLASRNGDQGVQDFSPHTPRQVGRVDEDLGSKYGSSDKIAYQNTRRDSSASHDTRVSYRSPQADERREFMISPGSSSGVPARRLSGTQSDSAINYTSGLLHPGLTTDERRGSFDTPARRLSGTQSDSAIDYDPGFLHRALTTDERRESMVSQGSSFGTPARRLPDTQSNSAIDCNPGLLHPGRTTDKRRGSFGTPARRLSGTQSDTTIDYTPGLVHPALTTDNNRGQSMYAIPEHLAVQEFAFRRGQQDRGNTRNRVPPNPFHQSFGGTWINFYHKGRRSGAEAVKLPTIPASLTRGNYDWPPLINPYTQSPEHPNGIYDEEYSRKICASALDGMESLIKRMCRHGKDWEKIVCAVPSPIAVALLNYPDLLARYEALQQATKEAKAGGRPYPPARKGKHAVGR